MGLREDRDEHDLTVPIVSISLRLPPVLRFGGLECSAWPVRLHPLAHGDVIAWEGAARMSFHGECLSPKGVTPDSTASESICRCGALARLNPRA
jgi:alkylated DNA repair dioxygenase AlkB